MSSDHLDFTEAFVSGSFISDDPSPSLSVPPLVTERAFAYVDGLKRFLKANPRRPENTPYWIQHNGTMVPWFEVLPGYADLVRAHELLVSTKLDPVATRRTVTASSRAYVGTAVLAHRYFSENQSTPRPRILVIGAGNGVDLQRLVLAKKARQVECVDCLDISDIHIEELEEARKVSGLSGRNFFTDALSPESPLNQDGAYDLIFIHMALHYVCTTKAKLDRFVALSRRCLRPGGAVIGTYPESDRADVMEGAGTFVKIGTLYPTKDREWGGARVSIDDKIWDDPALPLDVLVDSLHSGGMTLESWLLPETLAVHKQYVPTRMSDFIQFKELGYFRAFSFSATEAFAGSEPCTLLNPRMQPTSSYPMAIETAELGINYGVPITSEDIPWLLHTDAYVKTKENGQMGTLIAADGALFLRMRSGDTFVYPDIPVRKEWAVQVEVVGPMENPRYMLSDPLVVPGTARATPFHARLKAWKAFRPSCPGALLVETGDWLPATTENIRQVWHQSEEGIIFQYLAALPVTYRSAQNVRGSMRYLKKVWTVDVTPRKVVELEHGGMHYRIDNTAGGCVKEFLLTGDGAVFNRDRLDKTVGNTQLQLERMKSVLSFDGVLAITSSRGVVPPPLLTPLPGDPSPAELAALILHTGDFAGKLSDVKSAKLLQQLLRSQLMNGALPDNVAHCLESFGWSWGSLIFGAADLQRAEFLGRAIDLMDPLDIVEEYITKGAASMFAPAMASPLPTAIYEELAKATSTNNIKLAH